MKTYVGIEGVQRPGESDRDYARRHAFTRAQNNSTPDAADYAEWYVQQWDQDPELGLHLAHPDGYRLFSEERRRYEARGH